MRTRSFLTAWRLPASAGLLFLLMLAAHAAPQVKVLLCAGDYGMWSQDRALRIMQAVEKAAPGAVSCEVLQSFNFVKQLETPGFAERFDVIVCGDIAIGQFTTAAQQAIIRFVNNGGGFIWALESKSYIHVMGPHEVEPAPLGDILPYNFPNPDPVKDARPDAVAVKFTDPFLKGLDFSPVTILKPDRLAAPLFLERKQGKGSVVALYGAFAATYVPNGYAHYDRVKGGWDDWPQQGEFWTRLLKREAAASPIAGLSRADVDAPVKEQPLSVTVNVDAQKTIDDIRAADFSIVSLGQLYREDGGANEDMFLALNPRDWLDRSSNDVLENKLGKAFPDKVALYKKFNIKGILASHNAYGSYYFWTADEKKKELAGLIDMAKKYPDQLSYFQPGNEPPCDENLYKFYNEFATAMIKEAPALKVVGPGCAFNIEGPHEQGMKDFIATCGANTDVLNWHIYACPPANVINQVRYWTKYCDGKLRTKGPVKVMFTEADTWNTRDSQFNYLMDRAFTFLPEKEIIACFEYCMDSRYEGGTYFFGVMQPEKDNKGNPNEFRASYTGYWIFRNLRGQMLDTKITGAAAGPANHVHAISSSTDGGKVVTTVVYYDTGYFDGGAKAKSSQATVTVNVALPAGAYRLERSNANWNTNTVTPIDGTVKATAKVTLTLAPCQAVALTWTRQD